MHVYNCVFLILAISFFFDLIAFPRFTELDARWCERAARIGLRFTTLMLHRRRRRRLSLSNPKSCHLVLWERHPSSRPNGASGRQDVSLMQRLISIVAGVTQARPLEISGKFLPPYPFHLRCRLALFRNVLRLSLMFSGNIVF